MTYLYEAKYEKMGCQLDRLTTDVDSLHIVADGIIQAAKIARLWVQDVKKQNPDEPLYSITQITLVNWSVLDEDLYDGVLSEPR